MRRIGRSFELELGSLRYPPVSEDLWIRHLRTGQVDLLALGAGLQEPRPENYIVSGLVDFDDIAYDDHADLLYDLAGQVVRHLRTYLSEEDVVRVMRYHRREIAHLVHVQMLAHFQEPASGGYEVVISRGLTPLRESAYTAVSDNVVDYRFTPTDRSNIAKYLFVGFAKCLYDKQKFQSDPERRFAGILERDAMKWMKPARGQFQIHYRAGLGQAEYQPDFVAETAAEILMIDVKSSGELDDPVVLAKQAVAREWCGHATTFTAKHGGKPWRCVMVPHDRVTTTRVWSG